MLRELLQQEEIEATIENNEERMKALFAQLKEMDQEVETLFADLEVTPQQVKAFVENRENFTEENWTEIQKRLDEHISLKADLLPNRTKLRKVYQERASIQPTWLFVR